MLGWAIAAAGERDGAAASQLSAAVAAFRAPAVVEVAGRAGVGRTGVAALLDARLPEADVRDSAAIDVPGAADPDLCGDVVVYVVAGSVRRADRDTLARLDPARTLLVLAKADLAASWYDAAQTADAAGAEYGIPAAAMTTIGADDTASGRAGVVALARQRVEFALAARGDALVARVEEIAARSPAARDVLEDWLLGDDAAEIAAAAAVATVAHLPLPQSADPLDRARAWAWHRDRAATARDRRALDALVAVELRRWDPAPDGGVRDR
ncbi:hypothetical protein DW322_06985 [Rhodococcus rhodnii]|uniref:Uncharacterized protein n=1 Tax=Rhodococcus rhodnii TaxID=38312 RepID=A0A6P2CBV8_9NOCA|nr:hypothetical protein DW322_06985 [Rhodococcus rhodnii]